jgi:hypothetical protein
MKLMILFLSVIILSSSITCKTQDRGPEYESPEIVKNLQSGHAKVALDYKQMVMLIIN